MPAAATARTPGSTRQTTEEGMLRSGAIVTRAGPIEYLRSELGLDGDGRITIERTLDSISHPETLASLRGAPITLGHPPEGVHPDNWKREVVGAIAGEPRVVGNAVAADILVGDREALQEIDAGIAELSIGYDMRITRDGRTVGPLKVNHVAIVERGRAGPDVRVLDSATFTDEEDGEMTKQEMHDAMDAAVDRAMRKMGSDASQADMGKAIKDALAPVFDGMKRIEDEAKKVSDAAAADDAKKKASDAADKLVKETQDAERARFAVLMDAMPLIPEEKRAALASADAKTILAAALADIVPDAANQSLDYLRGVLAFRKTQLGDAAAGGVGTTLSDGYRLPPGVTPSPGQGSTPGNVHDAAATAPAAGVGSGVVGTIPGVTAADSPDTVRLKARDAYVNAQAEAYSKAGGI